MIEFYLYFTCLILSAMLRGLDHVDYWKIDQTWLPTQILNWTTRFQVVDSWHVYKGGTLLFFGLGMFFSPFPLYCKLIEFYLYFECFNLFFHVVYLYPKFWEFPFIRIITRGVGK